MKALYRTVSALLAIAAGVVFAMLITALIDNREIQVVGFVGFALAGVLGAVMSLVLWARTLDRR